MKNFQFFLCGAEIVERSVKLGKYPVKHERNMKTVLLNIFNNVLMFFKKFDLQQISLKNPRVLITNMYACMFQSATKITILFSETCFLQRDKKNSKSTHFEAKQEIQH